MPRLRDRIIALPVTAIAAATGAITYYPLGIPDGAGAVNNAGVYRNIRLKGFAVEVDSLTVRILGIGYTPVDNSGISYEIVSYNANGHWALLNTAGTQFWDMDTVLEDIRNLVVYVYNTDGANAHNFTVWFRYEPIK